MFVQSEMEVAQDPRTPKVESSTQTSLDSQSDQQNQNNNASEAPPSDSALASVSGNGGRKVTREDIELVQNLIERCLQLYMTQDEVVETLLNRARIAPDFTTLVWQKLEEENAEFFRVYYIWLKLKKQIIVFNHFLEHQSHMMRYRQPPQVPLTPIQNGMHPLPVNNLPIGYPVLQPPLIPAAGQSSIDASHGMPSCLVVSGIPAAGGFQPIGTDSGNDMVMKTPNSAENSAAIHPCSEIPSMPGMPISPTSISSSGDFPFASSEIPGIGVETSGMDTDFQPDITNPVDLPLPTDGEDGNSRDFLRSLSQIPWNFSFSDLTADLANLADLGPLGNYPGSPYLPSDSDILLDSPEEDIVDEYFVDSIPTPQSDEENP